MLSHFSHVQLFVTLWTVAYQASLSMGFSRQKYWSGLAFPAPGDLPDPGIEPTSFNSLALAHPHYQVVIIYSPLPSLGNDVRQWTMWLKIDPVSQSEGGRKDSGQQSNISGPNQPHLLLPNPTATELFPEPLQMHWHLKVPSDLSGTSLVVRWLRLRASDARECSLCRNNNNPWLGN